MGESAKKEASTTLGQYCALAAYQLMNSILRITDIRLVALFGRCIGYLVWMFAPMRRRIVARNLRIILDPRLRQDKLSSLVRRNMVRTTMNLACSLKTGLMTEREVECAIHMEGAEFFENSGMNGHTVICCIPHAGNWEILARIRPYFTQVEHFGSMYRRMNNPLLERLVYKSRTRFGCEMFSKEEGLKAVLRLARTGGLLGILSDQFTQEGLFLPYFGKVTGTTPLPALVYKRCKGKGHLFCVFTRNTALGKWDAVLNQNIDIPEGNTGIAALTRLVNQALEKVQSENILDGFWMHHRWKSTHDFAPEQDPETTEVARMSTKLPFRVIVAVPEQFEEAALLIPVLRLLKASRFDMQVTILCPLEQKCWWARRKDLVSYVVTSDDNQSPFDQLENDEIYKDGPFDYLFMFSENKKVFRSLRKLMPLYVAGFASNPLSHHFRSRYTLQATAPAGHRTEDYLWGMRQAHNLKVIPADLFAPLQQQEGAVGTFIAPFSTLGQADSWSEKNWEALVEQLGASTTTLLALRRDAARAKQLAQKLHIQYHITEPEGVEDLLGKGSKLYAVDGLLPLLASYTGCSCTVIMGSRQVERYRLTGSQHRHVVNHVPCHPCYAKTCDMSRHCTDSICVNEVLDSPCHGVGG